MDDSTMRDRIWGMGDETESDDAILKLETIKNSEWEGDEGDADENLDQEE